MARAPVTWFPGAAVGRYQLITPLASGGMAEIWLARQPGLHGFEKIVVIKRMSASLEDDPEQVRMFLGEARLAADLTHPNVVQIFELGEDQGAYFIAMEFLDGESLSTTWKEGLKREQPLPGPLAAQVVASAAEGLHYVHTRVGPDGAPMSLVHRDVSPQNLIVTYDGGVKLVDFGIAKVGTQATSSGKLKGKLAYMSPEQGRSEALDARSDVFALGVVLFEMVTRTRLFPRLEEHEILRRIVSSTPLPRARDRRPDVPEMLERIIMKATAVNRDDRFSSARELQVALEDFLLRTGRRTTGADIADYMKALFKERIEERRALLDSVRRGDLTPGQVPRMFPGSSESSGSVSDRPTAVSQTSLPVVPSPNILRTAALALGAMSAAALLAWLGASMLSPSHVEAADAGLASPAPAPARLTVNSKPTGARVQLDGAGRGVTPLDIAGLDTGPHELTLSLAGHSTEKRQVIVTPGEHLNLVVDLDALEPPDAGRRAEVRPQKMGKLTLDTTPWTTVYSGNKRLGDTPLIQYALPGGKQVLRLVNPEQNLNSTIEVEITPNELTVKKLVLQ